MYLVFTDESGTNKDSTLTLYGGLALHESNIVKSEMIISDIANEFLSIDNLLNIEIHFVDIFNFVFYNKFPSKKRKKELFQKNILPLIQKNELNEEKLSKLVLELFQFLSKVNASFLVSVINRKTFSSNVDAYVFKSFLNLLDHFLNSKNENGILIADGFHNQLSKSYSTNNLYLPKIDSEKLDKKELLFKRVLFESLSWKNRIEIEENFVLKYKFESKIYNILGNIFFVPSYESSLIQVSDILLYVMKKYLEYKLFNIEKLRKFFTKDFEATLYFLFSKENLKLTTLTDDLDLALVDCETLVDFLRGR